MDQIAHDIRGGAPSDYYMAEFIVMDCSSPYNAILGCPTLGKIKAITSTYHMRIKFSTSTGGRRGEGAAKRLRDNASSQV